MENRSTEEIEQSIERLMEDLRAVVHDGEELLNAGAHSLSERGVAARERLAAGLEVARDTRQKLEVYARDSARAADRAIREHPYQSVGAAFGIGLLIGVLANRN